MGTINFLFGVHNHQPVGNFSHVFKDAFKSCYHPFLEVLSKHPKVRISLHYTGSLLEWIEENEAHHFDLLKELIKRKQIEILGGAFYEPILSIIPKEDAVGQIDLMTRYVREKLGYQVEGMWLAERIWEPQLVKTIKLSKMKYTILDDSHFSYASLAKSKMFGYYITEYGGETIGVFPIDKELRYLIPFKSAEETINYLRNISAEYEGKGVTIADDGEKFGFWPYTYDWVYKQKYLEHLFSLLEENSDWIHMLTFSEYFKKYSPMGKIYLPTAAYEEMMEWSLFSKTQRAYKNVINEMKADNKYETYRPFIRGGFWRNFLVKYTEANLMYCKIWHVSKKVHAKLSKNEEAKKELWKAQCNCSFWHGLFGGLYLNYLRHAVYEQLLKAEKLVDEEEKIEDNQYLVEEYDYDKDGFKEVLVSSKKVNLYFSPQYGGSLFELDYKEENFNLTNVLTRRKEEYHTNVLAEKNEAKGGENPPETIHDIAHSKEPGLENFLFYDWYNKFSFLDHFLNLNTTFENFYKNRYYEEGDFVNQPYLFAGANKVNDKQILKFNREGMLYRQDEKKYKIVVEKTFTIDGRKPEIDVEYKIFNKNLEPLELWFGTELNLTLLAGDDKKRFYQIGKTVSHRLKVKKEAFDVKEIKLFDLWKNFAIYVISKKAGNIWYFPIETISRSEGGIEKTYQGSTIFPNWKLALNAGENKVIELSLIIKKLKQK